MFHWRDISKFLRNIAFFRYFGDKPSLQHLSARLALGMFKKRCHWWHPRGKKHLQLGSTKRKNLPHFTNPFTDSTVWPFFLRHHFVSGKTRVLKHWWQAGADAREALDDCERRHESIIVLSLINTNQWKNPWLFDVYMGVSKNNGTPKWMVYNGKPY